MHARLIQEGWNEKLPPICPGCGYNLTGIQSRRCPECGRGILWHELRTNARTTYHALRQVEDVNDLLSVGLWLGIGGLVILLLFYAVDLGGLGRVLGFFLGLATIGSAVQVFRVRRFPPWAKEFLTVHPNYLRSLGTILLGFTVMVLAVFLP